MAPVVLAPPTPAQATPIAPDICRVLSGASLDWSELEVCSLYGNREPAVVGLAGGVLKIMPDPLVLNSVADLLPGTTNVKSFTVRPGATPEAPGTLFFTNATGLAAAEASAEWTIGSVSAITAGSWVDAVDLRVEAIQGQFHILGRSADGTKILSASEDSSRVWSFMTIFQSSATIYDYDLLDWDGDSQLDLVVLCDGWLHVHEPGVGLIQSIAATSMATPDDRIEVVDDWVAWSTFNGNGDPILRSLNATQTFANELLSFAVVAGGAIQPLDVAGMTAGDVNGDGMTDLVLTDAATHRAVNVYRVLSASGYGQGLPTRLFDTADSVYGYTLLHLDESNPASSGAANEAAPCIADIDVDGKSDPLFLLDNAAELVAFPNTPAAGGVVFSSAGTNVMDATTYYTTTTEGAQAPPLCWPYYSTPPPLCDTGYINLAWDFASSSTVTQYPYVQVAMWRQDSPAASLTAMGVYHHIHSLIPLNGAWNELHQWIQVPVPEKLLTWHDPNAPSQDGAHFYLRYRFVDLASPTSMSVVSASASRTIGFSMDRDGIVSAQGNYLPYTAPFSYLASISSSDFAFPLYEVAIAASGIAGGTSVGAVYTDLVPPSPPPMQMMTLPALQGTPAPPMGFFWQ